MLNLSSEQEDIVPNPNTNTYHIIMDNNQYNYRSYPYGPNNSLIKTYERKPLCTEMTVMEFQSAVPMYMSTSINFFMNYDQTKTSTIDMSKWLFTFYDENDTPHYYNPYLMTISYNNNISYNGNLKPIASIDAHINNTQELGSKPVCPIIPTSTRMTPTSTRMTPTSTRMTPTSTGVQPTSTGVQPTSTGMTPTSTGVQPTSTGVHSTSTGMTPTSTGVQPTSTSSSLTQNEMLDYALKFFSTYMKGSSTQSNVRNYSAPGTFASQIDYHGSTNVYSPLIEMNGRYDIFQNMPDADNFYHL